MFIGIIRSKIPILMGPLAPKTATLRLASSPSIDNLALFVRATPLGENCSLRRNKSVVKMHCVAHSPIKELLPQLVNDVVISLQALVCVRNKILEKPRPLCQD